MQRRKPHPQSQFPVPFQLPHRARKRNVRPHVVNLNNPPRNQVPARPPHALNQARVRYLRQHPVKQPPRCLNK